MVTGRSMVSCALPGCEPPMSSAAMQTQVEAHVEADERSIMLVARSRSHGASGHRNFADVLGHLVALLHGRALGDGRVPAFHVRILVEIDGLPFVARHPRPDRDVGDGVAVRDEL